jgi:hypothetical protein
MGNSAAFAGFFTGRLSPGARRLMNRSRVAQSTLQVSFEKPGDAVKVQYL